MDTLKKYYWVLIILLVVLLYLQWDYIPKAAASITGTKPPTKPLGDVKGLQYSYTNLDMNKTLYAGIGKCDEVRQLQAWLIGLGYSVGNSGPNKDGIDGVFGSMTTAALGKCTNGNVNLSLNQFVNYISANIALSYGNTQLQPNYNLNPYVITVGDA